MKTLMFFLFMLLLPLCGMAEILNVPDDFETIQGAIDEAEDGDTVLVQPGRYVENINFEGKAITVASLILTTDNRAYIDSTIIDGNEQGCVVSFNNEEGNDSVLRGFTITNGSQEYGGGIDCQSNASPTLLDLIITGNEADVFGGGVYCTSGASPIISRVTIEDNIAVSGAGIGIVIDCRPSLTEVVLQGNIAQEYGGGIYLSLSSLSVSNSLFSNNRAGNAGGLYVGWGSNATLNNLTFYGNTGSGSAIKLRSILDHPSEATLTNTIIWGNDSPLIVLLTSNEAASSVLSVSFSDIQGGQDDVELEDNCVLEWLDGNIVEDPLFVDPDNGDFHLTADSPCIDAGDPDSPEDPDGTRTDMGAFYFNQYRLVHVPEDYETIQAAIDAVMDGDTVLVHPGNYFENIDFNGKGVILASLYLTTGDTAYVDSTIIDGNGNGSVVNLGEQSDIHPQLIGFTIQNGRGTEFQERVCGGGIFITDAEPVIIRCVIRDCSAQYGGGVFGFSLYDSPQPGPELIDCIILDNSASFGGGIYLDARISDITGCTVNGNSAESSGGGIYFKFDSEVDFSNCTFLENTCGDAGAGICGLESSTSFTRLNMGMNESGFQAGGIYLSDTPSRLRFSALWANLAGERCGGIVLDEGSTMDVVNCTFTENWAGAVRCGIHIRNGSSSIIVNSIFWHNRPAQLCFGDGENNVFTVAYSNIEEGRDGIIGNGQVNWCQGNTNTDPLFANIDEHDYSLSEESPCIDAGSPSFFWDNRDIVHLTPDEYNSIAPDLGAFESEYSDVSGQNPNTPIEFALYPAFPNPFNSTITISFSLSHCGNASLMLYDALGRLVLDVATKTRMDAGEHRVVIDVAGLSAGVYWVRLINNRGGEALQPIVLVK